MKRLLLITLTTFFSISAFADCSNTKTSFEAQKCLNQEVKALKTQLNAIYKKAHETTSAKEELDNAQKQWLSFKEKQCGDFVVADTQGAGGMYTALKIGKQNFLIEESTMNPDSEDRSIVMGKDVDHFMDAVEYSRDFKTKKVIKNFKSDSWSCYSQIKGKLDVCYTTR